MAEKLLPTGEQVNEGATEAQRITPTGAQFHQQATATAGVPKTNRLALLGVG